MVSGVSDSHHLVKHPHVPGFFSEEQGKALSGHRFSLEAHDPAVFPVPHPTAGLGDTSKRS